MNERIKREAEKVEREEMERMGEKKEQGSENLFDWKTPFAHFSLQKETISPFRITFRIIVDNGIKHYWMWWWKGGESLCSMYKSPKLKMDTLW